MLPRYEYHPNAAINLTVIRPFTKDDFYCALEQIKQSPLFQNLRVAPEYATEGGFMISGHERHPDVVGNNYKCIRFTGNSAWEFPGNIENWKDSEDAIFKRENYMSDPTSRRNRKRGWQDLTFVCKATTDVPRWTKEQLMVFVDALLSTGAFQLQARRNPVNLRY